MFCRTPLTPLSTTVKTGCQTHVTKIQSLLHFRKVTFTCSRFYKEMCSFDHRLLNLKVIGTEQDAAIYNGFSMNNSELKLLLYAYHLDKCNCHKLSQFHENKGPQRKY